MLETKFPSISNNGGVYFEKGIRSSNIELLRIFCMFLIVAHHLVVFSPIYQNCISKTEQTFNSYYLLVFGGFGKIGINCFVLITSYFMSAKDIKIQKLIKLILQIEFWRIVISLLFLFSGHKVLLSDLFIYPTVQSLKTGFIPTFLLFYLTIPFLNKIINRCSEKQHLLLIIVRFIIFSLLGPLFPFFHTYLIWFPVLFFVGSYIRRYNTLFLKKVWYLLGLISFSISVFMIIVGTKSGQPYYWVVDSQKPLAFITSICFFCAFKNIKMPNSRIINIIAATTFGIFLIHSDNRLMHDFIFNDILKSSELLNSEYTVIKSVVYTLLVFSFCSILDFVRSRTFEGKYMKLIHKVPLVSR